MYLLISNGNKENNTFIRNSGQKATLMGVQKPIQLNLFSLFLRQDIITVSIQPLGRNVARTGVQSHGVLFGQWLYCSMKALDRRKSKEMSWVSGKPLNSLNLTGGPLVAPSYPLLTLRSSGLQAGPRPQSSLSLRVLPQRQRAGGLFTHQTHSLEVRIFL